MVVLTAVMTAGATSLADSRMTRKRRLLPLRSALAAMLAADLSTALTVIIRVGGWWLDQKMLCCRTPVRATLGLVPLAIGSWISLTILFALAFKVPGAYGPVQYWVGSAEAHRFIAGPRTVALFAIWGGILFTSLSAMATAISLTRSPTGTRLKRMVLPAVALASYGLAWWLFIRCGFYPSA